MKGNRERGWLNKLKEMESASLMAQKEYFTCKYLYHDQIKEEILVHSNIFAKVFEVCSENE